MRAKDDEKKRTMTGTHDEKKYPSGVHATKMGPDDFQLHIHSDHGTGGNWCAKIFFFSLFVILLGLICLIIIENRGLKDLDKAVSGSRYAEILDDWIDDDDLDALADDHGGNNQMHDKDNGDQDHHEDHEEHEGLLADNSSELNDETEDKDDEQENNQSEEEDPIENDNDKRADRPISIEIDDGDEELSDEQIDKPDVSYIVGAKFSNLKEIEIDDPQENEIAEDNDMDEIEEHEIEDVSTADDNSDEASAETNTLAVRIVVGLALVIVAHQVLLKSPRTNHGDQYSVSQDPDAIEESDEIIEMKRRFTLVTAEEPIPLSEEDMKEHPPIIDDITPASEGPQRLLITQENDPFIISNLATDEMVKDTISEEEPFEDDPISDEIALNDEINDVDSGEEEELISSEDIYSDEEINDYESSETSDIDDSDLLKRLDEKYGRLPQHTDDDIDNDPTWTKIDQSGPAAAP